MPSPFPGMDPYLEGSTWMNFHGQLCAEIARQLGPKLRPRYLARLTERFFTDITLDPYASKRISSPDVGVVEQGQLPPFHGGHAIATAPVRVATEVPEQVLHFAVEIRDRLESRLVTSIEVLSPTNKRGVGLDEYLAKRGHTLRSTAHLIEIDLLHIGQRLPMRQAIPQAPYYVYVGRYEIHPETDVWPIALDQSLPTIGVPLLPGDDDVGLDLRLALTTVYDLSGYDLELDYEQPPATTLSAGELAWIDRHLRAAGLRA
jgi:hypothetical protein